MFFCNSGDMAVVNALSEVHLTHFWDTVGKKDIPTVVGMTTRPHKSIAVPHGSVVLTLERSLPPFYRKDKIKCLWKEKILFLKRTELETVTRFKHLFPEWELR